jgi:hypothetical protein
MCCFFNFSPWAELLSLMFILMCRRSLFRLLFVLLLRNLHIFGYNFRLEFSSGSLFVSVIILIIFESVEYYLDLIKTQSKVNSWLLAFLFMLKFLLGDPLFPFSSCLHLLLLIQHSLFGQIYHKARTSSRIQVFKKVFLEMTSFGILWLLLLFFESVFVRLIHDNILTLILKFLGDCT